eukprot:Hpha_TRINITY_DN15940_c2_g2::TRINITY_DN15940_c2_g2_i1::g.70766::m.70766
MDLSKWAQEEARKRVEEQSREYEKSANEQSKKRAEAQLAWEELQMDMVRKRREREMDRRKGEYQRLGRNRVGAPPSGSLVSDARDRVAQAAALIRASEEERNARKYEKSRTKKVVDQMLVADETTRAVKKQNLLEKEVAKLEKMNKGQMKAVKDELTIAEARTKQGLQAASHDWAMKEARRLLAQQQEEEKQALGGQAGAKRKRDYLAPGEMFLSPEEQRQLKHQRIEERRREKSKHAQQDLSRTLAKNYYSGADIGEDAAEC